MKANRSEAPAIGAGEVEALVEGRVLLPVSNGDRIRVHGEFAEASRLLRAMHRVNVLGDPRRTALDAYLREHFSEAELDDLLKRQHAPRHYRYNVRADVAALVEQANHVRRFLEAEPGASAARIVTAADGRRSARRGPLRPSAADRTTAADLQALLRALIEEPAPVPLAGLAARLPDLPGERLGRAIQAGLGAVLVVAGLDDDLRPRLGLLPRTLQRLRRGPPPPLEPVEPHQVHLGTWAVEDLIQLLVRAGETIRVTTDGSLFARARRELEATLAPLPGWLVEHAWIPISRPPERLDQAVARALQCSLCRMEGKAGRDRRLALTADGLRWLELGPTERLRALLDPLGPREDERDALDEDDLFSPYALDTWDLHDDGYGLLRTTSLRAVDNRLATALRALDVGSPVNAHAFLRRQVELHNPYLGASENRRSSPWGRLTEEQAEELWFDELRTSLARQLLPLGAVRAGCSADGVPTLELAPAGRYLIGATDELALEAAPLPQGGPPARIGPDFEVVFLAPDPALEASCGLFAERLGTGVGRLFRLTRESILAAANAGASAESVLDTLRRASGSALPRNVEHEVRSWFALHRRLTIEELPIVRCPDAETAERLVAAAGTRVERLSETIVLVRDPKQAANLQKACKRAGIFLLRPAERRKQRHRRRTSY